MKYKLAIIFTALVMAGCQPNAVDSELVDVKVIYVWTADDFNNAVAKYGGFWSTGSIMYPHMIVEEVATQHRVRIMGVPLGNTNEIFTVQRRLLK